MVDDWDIICEIVRKTIGKNRQNILKIDIDLFFYFNLNISLFHIYQINIHQHEFTLNVLPFPIPTIPKYNQNEDKL